MRSPAPNPIFDQLFNRSAPQILRGNHQRDQPPTDGGRWPVSVVATGATGQLRERLDGLLTEVARYTGPGHFMTGRSDSAHITVRALEPYREAAAEGDLIVGDWTGAMKRTAAAVPPFTLRCTGLTLTTGGILAQLEPDDSTAWDLLDKFRAELGDLAWFEDRWMKRNIWYCSLMHFVADIRDPQGVVEWVVARRAFDQPTCFEVTGLDLVRFQHTVLPTGDHYMRPSRWCSAELSGLAGPRPEPADVARL